MSKCGTCKKMQKSAENRHVRCKHHDGDIGAKASRSRGIVSTLMVNKRKRERKRGFKNE